MRYLLVLLLAGCASTSDVIAYGPNTWMVTSDDTTGFNARGATQARAAERANEFCARDGKAMVVKDSTAGGNAWTGTSARLIFSCAAR